MELSKSSKIQYMVVASVENAETTSEVSRASGFKRQNEMKYMELCYLVIAVCKLQMGVPVVDVFPTFASKHSQMRVKMIRVHNIA